MRRLTVVLPLLVLLAGCAGAGQAAKSSATGDVAGAKAAPALAKQSDRVVARANQVQVPRSLIRTASIDVRVSDVRTATTEATTAATQSGGEVVDEQVDLTSSSPNATMTLHVPPARLDVTLAQLSRLGHETSRTLGTEDVTDTVVDLDSRLATQQASVTRVRALLDRASSLADVVRIEAELSRREADLESLQARVRALSGQVTMSVVTVHLTTSKAAAKRVAAVGFVDGLHGGWDALSVSARITGATVGALLPFLPLLAAAVWLALWWRRRTAAV